MARPIFNVIEPNHNPFMISLDKCRWSCHTVDGLSTKICVLSETKGINIKIFNMTTRINEAKTFMKHILWDCKCNMDSTTRIKNGIMKYVNVSVKLIVQAKNIIVEI